MKVCLLKCANKEFHSDGNCAEDFKHGFKDAYGNLICDWCYWMWGA